MAVNNDSTPPTSADSTTAQSTGRKPMSPLRHRPLGRASTFAADIVGPRRSSNISESIDEARHSIKSSTDDLFLPRVQNGGLETSIEPSHWHSAPLVLALLPAIGGLLFQNGGAVITDVTLLTIAGIFLNWCVRLPWHWYLSAQSVRASPPSSPSRPPPPSDTIVEEDAQDSQNEFPTPPELQPPLLDELLGPKPLTPPQRSAMAELRIHELVALAACFVGPVIGAWLLHHIRGQLLTGPSEGLVSNYNLTIFLLASEVRPVSHLIKLVQARTLFLQRSLPPSDPSSDLSIVTPSTISALSTRLDELEAHIASTAAASKPKSPTTDPNTNNIQQQQQQQELITTVRKSLTPDIEALNRAVRRYEKRATLLAMQTESRLADLEARMNDAITLAAAAERGVSNFNRKSSLTTLFEWAVLPAQIAVAGLTFPLRVARVGTEVLREYVRGRIRTEVRTAKGAGGERERGKREKGRGAKKVM